MITLSLSTLERMYKMRKHVYNTHSELHSEVLRMKSRNHESEEWTILDVECEREVQLISLKCKQVIQFAPIVQVTETKQRVFSSKWLNNTRNILNSGNSQR